MILRPLYAILVDGGFITKRLYGQLNRHATADDIVAECDRLRALPDLADYELLRIYYYDAPPSSDSLNKPVSKSIYNLATTDRFRLSQSLYDHLVLKPHFSLRMGETRVSPYKWKMKPRSAKRIIREQAAQITITPIVDEDFDLDISQKGVDMRIGLDMARLALRETVRSIVVVTGDSDFIPAFKFARREGVKIILDPMGHNVRSELRAHSDLVI